MNYQDTFQFLTLTDDPKNDAEVIKELTNEEQKVFKAKKTLERWDRLRRHLRYVERLSGGTNSRTNLSKQRSSKAWFRVMEKAPPKSYKTDSTNEDKTSLGHVHLHVMTRNWFLPEVVKPKGMGWDHYQDNHFGKKQLLLQKQILKAGFGRVFYNENARNNHGLKGYLTQYLSKCGDNIWTAQDRMFRMYGASTNWNLDRDHLPSKWIPLGYSRGLADAHPELTCGCSNGDLRTMTWLDTIKPKTALRTWTLGRSLVVEDFQAEAPKGYLDRIAKRNLRIGVDI